MRGGVAGPDIQFHSMRPKEGEAGVAAPDVYFHSGIPKKRGWGRSTRH